jgi:hypothetical protein
MGAQPRAVETPARGYSHGMMETMTWKCRRVAERLRLIVSLM